MSSENGEWIMHGVDITDPCCIKTPEELIELVNTVGFLPLFKNEVSGFSVEERTVASHWWCDDEAIDPWEWRKVLARSGKVAYGKFFDRKAGFVSLEWLPRFINYRRDGYDFDARWDDGRANYKSKHIMELFCENRELFSNAMKDMAGFGKDGLKNFDGTVTDLQMQTYLTVCDFRRRLNKAGEPYGWGIAVYSTPEIMYGADFTASRYSEDPNDSYAAIEAKVRENFIADEKTLKKLLSVKR